MFKIKTLKKYRLFYRYHQYSLCMDSVFVKLPTCWHLFVTSKSIIIMLLWTFVDVLRALENLSCPVHMFPAEVKQGDCLSSYFSIKDVVNKHLFFAVFSEPCFFWIVVLLVILLFKMDSKFSVEKLSIFTPKNAVIYLQRNMF